MRCLRSVHQHDSEKGGGGGENLPISPPLDPRLIIKCIYCLSNQTVLIEVIIGIFLLSPVSMLSSFLIITVSSQRKSKRLLDDGDYTDQVKRPRNG